MPRHISLIFPGQGSQSLGMLSLFDNKDLNFISNISKDILPFDLLDIILHTPSQHCLQRPFYIIKNLYP